MKEQSEKNDEIMLEERFAVIGLPVETCSVEIRCGIMQDGETVYVNRKLTPSEIRTAFREAEKNYEPDDAEYCLTEQYKSNKPILVKPDDDFLHTIRDSSGRVVGCGNCSSCEECIYISCYDNPNRNGGRKNGK